MNKSWMPLTAGILEITSGAACLLGAFILFIIAIVGGSLIAFLSPDTDPMIPGIPVAVMLIIALPLLALGILSVIGGTSAIRAKNWGWALTGAITACFTSWILGIPAIIFTVISKDEFH